MKAYYHARALEYDDCWLGRGGFADRDRPDWKEELDELRLVVESLPPVRTLDVACGTGFLTRHLQGDIVGLDQSETMLEIARGQAPEATFVHGDALSLPFQDGEFDRLFTSYFYCHLEEPERVRFLAEARRVADELVIVGTRWREGEELTRTEERVLSDGSRWEVFKRVFVPEDLLAELGGGEVIHEGKRHFLVVRSP